MYNWNNVVDMVRAMLHLEPQQLISTCQNIRFTSQHCSSVQCRTISSSTVLRLQLRRPSFRQNFRMIRDMLCKGSGEPCIRVTSGIRTRNSRISGGLLAPRPACVPPDYCAYDGRRLSNLSTDSRRADSCAATGVVVIFPRLSLSARGLVLSKLLATRKDSANGACNDTGGAVHGVATARV